MGAKKGPRFELKYSTIRLEKIGSGLVAQVLHPLWVARGDISAMTDTIIQIDEALSKKPESIRLVLTGGGFIELEAKRNFTSREVQTEQLLDELLDYVKEKTIPLLRAMKSFQRDYIIGVDVFMRDYGIGQFALGIRQGNLVSTAWKSYPTTDEANWIAGFGTEKGRQAPRYYSSNLGETFILVCHDAQAFNHRNIALVHRNLNSNESSVRSLIIEEMTRQLNENKPNWILNLIHYIEKPVSLKTFSTSYKQINKDHSWNPRVIGAFGYGAEVAHNLPELARKAQGPLGCGGYAVILQAPLP